MSPFEVVYGFSMHKPVNFLPLLPLIHVSHSAESFVQHLHDIHESVRKYLHDNYHKYKLLADLPRMFKEYNVGDYLMICIRPERFPFGAVCKL